MEPLAQVGRYLMVQGAPQTAGRFDAEVRMYKAPPPEVAPKRSTDRPGQALPARLLHPDRLPAADHLGRAPRRPRPLGRHVARDISDYVHWSCLGALCEFLPLPDNRVTLAEEKDRPACRSRTSPTPSATTTVP